MKTHWTFAAFLLSAALGAAQDPKPQDVTMTCKAPALRDKQPRLTLNGTANFPEGTVLKVTLQRQYESYAGGTRLSPTLEQAGGLLLEVKGRKFQETPAVPGPGAFGAVVTFLDDYQKPAIMESLKGKITTRTWQFQFAAWGDDLIATLGPKLNELDLISRECIDIAARIEKLSGSEGSWVKERKNVDARGADLILTKEADEAVKELAKLMTRIDRSDLKAYFPAAHSELFFTIRNMHGNTQHFVYEQGKFAGAKSYHSGGDKLKTHRSEEFNFENLKRYLEEASPLAGREMALWIVKDLKRTSCQVRPDIQDALKNYGTHPGISFIADRLLKATVDDLKLFEEEIRTAGNEKKDDKDKKGGEWDCPICKKKNKAADATCKSTAECKGKKP
jgi:hypothetical protein